MKSATYTFKDARDLVVLAVGYTYLQAIADEARIETAEAQVKSAQAVYDQASDQVNAGTSPDIDGLRAKVELQTRQQQLIQAKNNFAIQKLTVARVIGLAPGQEFEFTDKSLYEPFEGITVDEALKRAYATRSDYQAAMAEVRAAEFSRKAAFAGYFPSLSVRDATQVDKEAVWAVAERIVAEVDTVLGEVAPGDLAVTEGSVAQCACSSPLPGGKLTIKGKTVRIPGLPLIFEQCAVTRHRGERQRRCVLARRGEDIYHGVAPEEEAEYRSALVAAYQEFKERH